MNNDAELLRRYVEERSEPAFTELVQRRIGLVYSIACRHTRDSHRAADATQKVFTALARNAAKLARQPVLVGWFYRSAHHAALNVIRDETRRQRHEQEVHDMQAILPKTPTEPDWQKVTPILDEVINELGDKDRDAVLLRFFDALPFAEIGARLRLSENAARMRVDRALEKLHARLNRRGITSTTGALALALANQVALAAPPHLAAAISSAAVAGSAAMTSSSVATVTSLLMNKPALIAATAALLAVGSTLYEFNAAQYARTVAASYQRENDALRARLAAAQKAPVPTTTDAGVSARLEPAMRRHPNHAESAPVAASPERAANPPDSPSRKGAVRADRQGKSVPVLPVGYLDNWLLTLYRQLGLSPAQVAEFKELVKENNRRHEQLDALALGQGFKVTDPEMEEFYVQADAEFHTKVAGIMGDEAAKEVRLFIDQLPLRDVAGQIAGLLVYTENPLSVTQTNALVALMWEHMRDGSGKITTKLASQTTAAMRTKAQEILLPGQYFVFRDWMDQLDKQNHAQTGTPK